MLGDEEDWTLELSEAQMAGVPGSIRDAAAAKALSASLQGRGEPDSWPETIAQYFLGKISGDDLIKAARNSPARLCEAYFHLGQAALLQKDPAEAAKLFSAARATGMSRFVEYAAATAELQRLEPAPAARPSGPG